MPTRIVAVCLSLLFLVAFAVADVRVVPTGTSLDLKLDSPQAISMAGPVPTVQGTVTVAPAPLRPSCERLVFRVDGKVAVSTTDWDARLVLDTHKLADGIHAISLEAQKAGGLVVATGDVTINVANKAGAEVMAATDEAAESSPPYIRLYRASVTHEAVWFNGDPGDLERHGYIAGGRMYITLNDLVRHVGGQVIWGPRATYVEVKRNDVTIRVAPGSSVARVNGLSINLGSPVVTHKSLTYVPLRAMCKLFGVYVEWNDAERRAYVQAPQMGFGIDRHQYPWVDTAGGRNFLGDSPSRLSFRNYTGLPVHVRFEGNGYMSDWQIHAWDILGPCPVPAGTYRVTVWSRQGEDFEAYITVASGVDDRYAITLDSIALEAH